MPKGDVINYTHQDVEYLMKCEDVAKYFKVGEQTVRLWIRDGKLKAYRVPHPDGLNDQIPAKERKTTIWITRDALMKWAELYYHL